ncbi:hypothetical protein EX30DRAFT_60837 [Ascodesmis nigricans]|uniref:Uncharacterized protein n=1 Tax=Ascodesmis nigricans TaxID=341454 RepID=A0A4S2MUA4_9PEZI|nr:hypothetical protein EX30DRAFT_60837 [Ascodesmis nigricans]
MAFFRYIPPSHLVFILGGARFLSPGCLYHIPPPLLIILIVYIIDIHIGDLFCCLSFLFLSLLLLDCLCVIVYTISGSSVGHGAGDGSVGVIKHSTYTGVYTHLC